MHPSPRRPAPRRVAASALVALALAGCGRAPAPAPPSASTAAQPAAASTPATTVDPTPAASGPGQVVGLGDSIMAGTNCSCTGPLDAYADAVERDGGARPDVTNLGVAGWTTQDLREFVTTDADARSALAAADTVVVIIGANDLFRMGAASRDGADATTLGRQALQLNAWVIAALEAVREAAGDGPDAYLVTGYWDILAPSGRSTTQSAAATAMVNEAIRAAAENVGMEYVDLAGPFDASGDVGALISDDGLHPNAEGVRIIGEALADAHA